MPQRDLSRGSKVIERVGTLSGDIENAAVQLAYASHACGLPQIDAQVVSDFELRLFEIHYPPTGFKAGLLRAPAQGFDLGFGGQKTELNLGVRGDGAIVAEFAIQLANIELPVIAARLRGIGHGEGDVIGAEIERHALMVPEQLTLVQLQAINR